MSMTAIIIAVLGIVVGYIVQSVNTGSLFGVVTVPKAWLPFLSLLSLFLAALVTSIASAPTKDQGAWIMAALAGLMALGGNATGATIKQQMDAHKRAMTPVPPSNDNATPDAKKAA